MFVLKSKYDKVVDEGDYLQRWVDELKSVPSEVCRLELEVCRLEAEKLELMKSTRSQLRADIMLELIDSLHGNNDLVTEWVKFKEGYVRVEE